MSLNQDSRSVTCVVSGLRRKFYGFWLWKRYISICYISLSHVLVVVSCFRWYCCCITSCKNRTTSLWNRLKLLSWQARKLTLSGSFCFDYFKFSSSSIIFGSVSVQSEQVRAKAVSFSCLAAKCQVVITSIIINLSLVIIMLSSLWSSTTFRWSSSYCHHFDDQQPSAGHQGWATGAAKRLLDICRLKHHAPLS